MLLHLKISGYIMLVLALVHVIFLRHFNWDKELQPISLINKQLMYVHTFFIALSVFLMGALLLYAPEDILQTRLGRVLGLGLAIFWGIRLFFQFFVYSSKLWKGKWFETTVHILFSLLWFYFTAIFFLVYYSYT